MVQTQRSLALQLALSQLPVDESPLLNRCLPAPAPQTLALRVWVSPAPCQGCSRATGSGGGAADAAHACKARGLPELVGTAISLLFICLLGMYGMFSSLSG